MSDKKGEVKFHNIRRSEGVRSMSYVELSKAVRRQIANDEAYWASIGLGGLQQEYPDGDPETVDMTKSGGDL